MNRKRKFLLAATLVLSLVPLRAWAAAAAPDSRSERGPTSAATVAGAPTANLGNFTGGNGILADSDLALGMSVDDPTPAVGGVVTYTITLTNQGPDDATGIEVTDLLPAGLTYASSTPGAGSYVSATGVWTVGGLVNGAQATLALSASVDPGTAGTSIVNDAAITANGNADPDPLDDTASQSISVPGADLAISMSADNVTPDVGNTVTYTITLTNQGPNDATGIAVTDLLPAGVTYVSSTPSAGSYVSATGVWSVGGIANGAQATLALSATVNAGTAGTTIVNDAAITASDIADPDALDNTASRSITVQSADLALAMSVNNATPNVGNVITYTITLTNQGPNPATGVAVTDLLPPGLTYVSSTPSAGSYVSGTGVWTVGGIMNGAQATLALSATVNTGTDGTSIVNSATITATNTFDADPLDDTASQSVTVQRADLAITMAVSDSVPDEHDEITITITLTNLGPHGATGVVVTDLLPAKLEYRSSTMSQGTYTSGTGLWNVGSLANGASVTLTIVAKVGSGTNGTRIVNTASITSSNQTDPVAANNTTSRSLYVDSSELAVSMTVDNPVSNEGRTVTFNLSVRNNGPKDAHGTKILDLLPAGMTYVSSTSSKGSYSSGTGIWNIGTINNGVTATLALRASLNAGTGGTTIINRASVWDLDEIDPVSTNDSTSRSVTVQLVELGVTMDVDDVAPNEGEAITFSLTVTNNGPDAATALVVSDLLPSGLAFSSATPSQGTYTAGTGAWAAGTLGVGSTATLTLVATPTAGSGGTTIVNTAVASADQADHVPANNSASRTVIVESANLGLALTVDNAAPRQGDSITYTLTLTHDGPDPAAGIAVTDLLPSGLTYAGSTPSQGTYASGTGLWSVGSMTPGTSATLVLVATVNSGTAGTTIVHNASITASDHRDVVPANNSASRSITVQSADLALTMAVSNSTPNVGATIIFTLTLTNNGPFTAAGIAVTDLLPAGLTYAGSTPSQGAYSSATGVWSVGSLASGVSVTLTLSATVDAGTLGTTMVNSAAVTASDLPDPVASNNTASRSVTVPLADLAYTMTVSNATPNEGATITYTILLRNNGPTTATGLVVADTLPAGLTFVSATATRGTYSNTTGLWSVGSLGTGSTGATLTLTALVGAGTGGTTITNRVGTASANQADPVPGNNTANAPITVRLADLGLAISVDDPAPNEGATATYTLTLTNYGPDAASGVRVTDLLPSGMTFVSATPGQGTYTSGTGVWNIGGVANAASVTLALRGRANTGTGGTTIVNSAAITAATEADHNASNNAATVPVTVQLADLAVSMTVNDAGPNEGGTITYTITLTNNGPDPASGIVVSDVLPAGLTYAGSTPGQGSYASGAWTVGSLANGASATLELAATVGTGTGGTTIVNRAAVAAADQADHSAANDSASASILVESADLALAMTVDDAGPNEGAAISFTLTLSNGGPDAAAGVTVSDVLPAGLSFVSATPSQGTFASGVWTVGSLATGASVSLVIGATVDAGTGGTTLVHAAGITASDHRDLVVANNTASRAVLVESADLGIALSVDTPITTVGSTVVFTLALTNGGPDAAAGITVANVKATGLTYTTSSASQGTYASATGAWTVGSLGAGATATLTMSATVDAGTLGTVMVHGASVTASDHRDLVATNDTATTTVTIPLADLGITMAVDDATPNEGETVTFTLTLRNYGPTVGTGVTVSDTLPAGLTFTGATASQGSYANGTGVWSVGTIADGDSAKLSISATVDAGTGSTTIANSVSITAASQADPVPGNNAAGLSVYIPLADLELTMAVDNTGPNEGAAVAYTLTVTNHGPDTATAVSVADALPAGLTLANAAASQGSYSDSLASWSIGALANNTLATLTLAATVDSGAGGTTILNRGRVSAAEADHDTTDNSASQLVTVPLADLGLVVTLDDPAPNQGEPVTYTVTLTNHGPDAASGIVVTAPLPPGLTFSGSTPSQGNHATGTGEWDVGALAGSAVATLTLMATVDTGTGGTTLVHAAAITAVDQADHEPGNDSTTTPLTVESADLGLAMRVSDGAPDEGDPVYFTLTLTNHGPDPAGGITVLDRLPVGLDYMNDTPGQGSYARPTGLWTVGTLAAGDSAVLVLGAVVTDGFGGSTLLHRAEITASDHRDTIAANDSASAGVTIPLADLALDLNVSDPTPNEGDGITCTLTITNHGPTAATAIAVGALLPAGLSYTASTPSQGTYAGGTGAWTVGSLGIGASATLVLDATVDAATGGSTITCTMAILAVNEADPDTLNDTASRPLTVQLADLRLEAAIDDPAPNEGATVTSTFTLTNDGPDAATGITVVDALPSGLTPVGATPSQGDYVAGTGEWSVGDLAAGAAATLTLVYTVDAGTGGTAIADTARVTAADQADHDPIDDAARWSLRVQTTDLGIAIAMDNAAPNEGAAVACTVTLTNHGPDAATGVGITAVLPAGLTFVNATPSQGSYSSGTGEWSLGGIANGASATLTLGATVDAGTGGGTLLTQASIRAADQADHAPANDTTGVRVYVPLADLALAMTVDEAAPAEGDTLMFALTLTNDGPDGATQISVASPLPEGLSYVGSERSQGTYTSATGIWNVGGLAPAGTATLTLIATVDAGTGGTVLLHRANVLSVDQADHAAANDSASSAVTVQSADLQVAMSADLIDPNEGAVVTFTVTLTNHGPDDAAGIAAAFTLPAGFGYQSTNPSQGNYALASGVWNAGALARGTNATLALRATVLSGTGGTDLTAGVRIGASDHPDPNPANNQATVTLAVRPSLNLTVTPRATIPMLADGPVQEIWRMKFVNPSAVAETLTSITFRNIARGPGSTSQLDAEWTALTAASIRQGVEQVDGQASFSAGQATFGGLVVSIPSRDSVELVLRGGATSLARVGDTLDVRLESETDLTFARAVTIRSSWPVDPAGAFVVDGMLASRIAIEPAGPGNLNAGLSRQLALETLLPPNGYTADRLQRLNVVNQGSAQPVDDIAKVEAWVDNGDGSFVPASDRRLGTLTFTGGRWELTRLAEAVSLAGLRVFWTVDLAPFATQGHTVRLEIPPAPDAGIGMESGNSGPLDQGVGEPWGFTISSLDRVTLSAAPLPAAVVRPGDRGVPLLHMIATNSYAADRTLSDLTITNGTTGPGTAAERDDEVRVVTLRDDGNHDGVLAGTDVDPVLGTGFFSNGTMAFSGLRWSLPAGQTRQLFVTADVSSEDAADGDVLSAVVADEFSVAFLEPTAVTGGWPLDSGCRLTVDGFAAVQLASMRTPSVTVGPNDASVLALDFIVPPDGYRGDVLRSVRVVNLGSASPADIAAMKLWRDGGDGVFSGGGDDVLVGPLVPQSGGWQSPLISVPVGAAGVRSFISVDISSAPAESVTVRLSIPVDGIDHQSGNDGPIDQPVANPDGLLVSGAPLLASISVPAATTLGQDVTVRMAVRNTSTETVNAVAPSTLALSGTGSLTLASGPSPASFALAPGAVDTFEWRYTANAIGDVRLTGNATGTGATSSLYRRAPFAASGLQQIFIGTNLLAMIPVQTMPVNVNRGQAGIVPFSLTLTNQGGAGASDARLSRMRIRLTDPAGQGIVPSSLLTRVEVNEGTNVYLVKTAIETSGSDIDLPLASPVVVNPEQPSTLTLRLDISPTTSVPAFLVSIPDSSWIEADDATSGAPVMVAVSPGGYPLRSAIARVVAETDRVTAELIAPDSSRVARGSDAVPLLRVRVDNPGTTGISSDVRVYSLAMDLIDADGAVIADPAGHIDYLRVRTGAQIVTSQLVEAGAGPRLTIPFSPPLTIPANSPLEVTIEGDIAAAASFGRFQARLADTTTFDARDATTRNPVPAAYATDPIAGGWVTVEAGADSLVAGGAPLFTASVLIGSTDIPALAVTLRNPGAPGTSRIRFDSLRVECRDDARRPFAPGAYFSRLAVVWNGTVVATASNPPGMGSVKVLLPGLLIEPADSAQMTIAVDISPAAPLGSIELMLAADGIGAVDANSGQVVHAGPSPGRDLPVLSGLARLQSPARSLSVGLTSRMATTFAADGSSMPAAVLALTNVDAAGAGSIRIDRLVLRAGDRSFAPLPVGAGAMNLEAWIDGAKWAESGPLAADAMTAALVAAAPVSIAPSETTQVEIRIVTRTDGAADGFRIGVEQSGIGVIQPSSALLAVGVQPAAGQSFPMWSEAAGLTANTLAASWSNFPNPFAAGREATTFVYYLPAAARVSLRIFTPRGESVATVLENLPRSTGLHQLDRWDGRNGRGQTVYNGVYVVELDVRFDDGTSSRLLRKLAVVR